LGVVFNIPGFHLGGSGAGGGGAGGGFSLEDLFAGTLEYEPEEEEEDEGITFDFDTYFEVYEDSFDNGNISIDVDLGYLSATDNQSGEILESGIGFSITIGIG